ncbi:MAG: hypothetical protein ACKO8I_14665 [Cyanobacteriota bacterium]
MTAERGDQQGGTLATASAETIVRAGEVLGWLVAGNSTREIYARTAAAWGVSTRQADRYLSHARQMLADAWAIERPDLTALLLSRTDQIYREAMACGNHGAALGAINAAARLAQL